MNRSPRTQLADGRQLTPQGADHIRLDQPPIAPAHATRLGQMLLPRDHQPGKVERILMRRRIRAVVIAELAVITLIGDPMVFGRCELGDVSLILVDAVEQRVERRTQIEAASAAIADLIDALRVFLQLRWVDGIDQAQAIHVAPIRKQSAVSYQRRGGVRPSSSPSEN